MESHQFRYVNVASSSSGCNKVGITFEREEGIRFCAILDVKDAKRLLADLPQPVRIADPGAD